MEVIILKYINLYYDGVIYKDVFLKKEYIEQCKSDVICVCNNDVELFRFIYDSNQFYYSKKVDIYYVFRYDEMENLNLFIN